MCAVCSLSNYVLVDVVHVCMCVKNVYWYGLKFVAKEKEVERNSDVFRF
jgi:hypothetical protein